MIKAKTNKSIIDLTNKSLSITKAKVLDPKLGLIYEHVLCAKHKDSNKTDIIRLNNVTCILASNDKDGEKEFYFTNGYEIGSKDWVDNRTKLIAKALSYHEGAYKDQPDDDDEDENPSNTKTVTQEPPKTQDTGSDVQQNPSTTQDTGSDVQQEPLPTIVKFTNTTNDKALTEEETVFKVGDNILGIIKELATNENTSEKFKSMILSDEYKFSYWSIVNEDGSETKINKGTVVESETITLKAHWKNK